MSHVHTSKYIRIFTRLLNETQYRNLFYTALSDCDFAIIVNVQYVALHHKVVLLCRGVHLTCFAQPSCMRALLLRAAMKIIHQMRNPSWENLLTEHPPYSFFKTRCNLVVSLESLLFQA